MIKDLDKGNELNCSANTVHRYMKVLGLKSITVKKRPKYVKGNCHKKFENLLKRELILHSDQGSQYTSKEFNDFCTDLDITQSMSKVGCPYDNAPMESFYGTLKAEYVSQHHFKDDERLNQGIYEEIYCWYNHVRPHSFNGGISPAMKRISYC